MLHTADISHPAKAWELHHRWTMSLLEEFFRQVPCCSANHAPTAVIHGHILNFIFQQRCEKDYCNYSHLCGGRVHSFFFFWSSGHVIFESHLNSDSRTVMVFLSYAKKKKKCISLWQSFVRMSADECFYFLRG